MLRILVQCFYLNMHDILVTCMSDQLDAEFGGKASDASFLPLDAVPLHLAIRRMERITARGIALVEREARETVQATCWEQNGEKLIKKIMFSSQRIKLS